MNQQTQDICLEIVLLAIRDLQQRMQEVERLVGLAKIEDKDTSESGEVVVSDD